MRAWHIEQGVEWHGGLRLARTLKGIGYLAPDESKRPPRLAFRAYMLDAVVEQLDLRDPFDSVVAAVAACALWGQARLLIGAHPRLIIRIRPLRDPNAHTPGPPFILGEFSRPSAAPNQNQPPERRSDHHHETVRPCQPTSTHCESPRKESPELHLASLLLPLGRLPFSSLQKNFMRRCNDILHDLGYSRITGHCFRIGGTTELLLAGVDPEVVKKLGRWKSDAFLRYRRTSRTSVNFTLRTWHGPSYTNVSDTNTMCSVQGRNMATRASRGGFRPCSHPKPCAFSPFGCFVL